MSPGKHQPSDKKVGKYRNQNCRSGQAYWREQEKQSVVGGTNSKTGKKFGGVFGVLGPGFSGRILLLMSAVSREGIGVRPGANFGIYSVLQLSNVLGLV